MSVLFIGLDDSMILLYVMLRLEELGQGSINLNFLLVTSYLPL